MELGVWYVPSSCGWVLREMLEIGKRDLVVRNSDFWEQTAFHLMCRQGRIPKVDKLEWILWNGPSGLVVRHWCGDHSKNDKGRWVKMRAVMESIMPM